jgi:hypothetical protein
MDLALHETSRERKLIEMRCGDLGCHSMAFYPSSISQEEYRPGMTTLCYGIVLVCILLRNPIFHDFLQSWN